MGKAGKALRKVLESYNISQYKLAKVMGIGRSNVSRWASEVRDPGGETILHIRQALQKIDARAAEDFVNFYLHKSENLENEEE